MHSTLDFKRPSCLYFMTIHHPTELHRIFRYTMFCAIACLVSPNKEYDVFIQASPSKGSTFEELSAILINAGEHTLVPESITINGIHGHHVKYTAGNERYYELRFRNPFNHQEYAQLTILISCPETCSDFPSKETHAIDSLIAGIRIEPITKSSTQWCSSLHVQKKTSVSTLQSRESPTVPRKGYCSAKALLSRERDTLPRKLLEKKKATRQSAECAPYSAVFG